MALVEDSEGDYFSQSDAEGGPDLGAARQDFRHVRSNDLAKVSELLKRRCSCVSGSCFTQLRGMESQLADLRRGFYEMPPNKKDPW